jgi:predicted SAM-dependent methyltransferase
LEHLKPMELELAFKEIYRVLKPGGQVVYGVPVERPFMVSMFRILGTDIRTHHFSTDKEIYQAALKVFTQQKIQKMVGPMGLFGQVYEIGHFKKLMDSMCRPAVKYESVIHAIIRWIDKAG